MKTKIVYVLVSREDDFFYEMFLISHYSLRLYHPKGDAEVVVVMDGDTFQRLLGKKSTVLDDVSCVVPDIPERYTVMQRSRYLKTNLRQFVAGDFLCLDTDTVICRPLNDADGFKGDICAVMDNHNPRSPLKKLPQTLSEWKYLEGEKFFNAGVIYAKDSDKAHQFFHCWHENWKFSVSRGCNLDQPSMRKTVLEGGVAVKELDGVWNCQIGFCGGVKFLDKAKIVHYFSNHYIKPSFYFGETFFKIKKDGILPEDLCAVIKQSNQAFNRMWVLLDTREYYQKKAVLDPLWDVYHDYPRFFTFITKLSSTYRKIVTSLWKLKLRIIQKK